MDKVHQQADGAAEDDAAPADQAPVEELASDVPGAVVPIDGVVLSEELTGRAASSGEDLTALFKNPGQDHLTDGFSGSGDDDVADDVERQSQNELGAEADDPDTSDLPDEP